MAKKKQQDISVVHPTPIKQMKNLGKNKKADLRFDATQVVWQMHEESLKMAYEMGVCHAERDYNTGVESVIRVVEEEENK